MYKRQLSDNMELSKQLGTRHRAGVGISEATDSLTIIVSEETGQVSVARGGELSRGLNSKQLREVLVSAQDVYKRQLPHRSDPGLWGLHISWMSRVSGFTREIMTSFWGH